MPADFAVAFLAVDALAARAVAAVRAGALLRAGVVDPDAAPLGSWTASTEGAALSAAALADVRAVVAFFAVVAPVFDGVAPAAVLFAVVEAFVAGLFGVGDFAVDAAEVLAIGVLGGVFLTGAFFAVVDGCAGGVASGT